MHKNKTRISNHTPAYIHNKRHPTNASQHQHTTRHTCAARCSRCSSDSSYQVRGSIRHLGTRAAQSRRRDGRMSLIVEPRRAYLLQQRQRPAGRAVAACARAVCAPCAADWQHGTCAPQRCDAVPFVPHDLNPDYVSYTCAQCAERNSARACACAPSAMRARGSRDDGVRTHTNASTSRLPSSTLRARARASM